MITIVEKAWKIQKRIEQQIKDWKNCLPSNTLYWRHGDFSVFLFGTVLFFGVAVAIMIISYNPIQGRCITDYWLVPIGIGEVFLFLFFICKKVDGDDEE